MSFYTTINNIRICGNCGDIVFTGDQCPVCHSNHNEPLHHFIKTMNYVTQAKEEKNRTKPLITPHSWFRYDPFARRRVSHDLSLQKKKRTHYIHDLTFMLSMLRSAVAAFRAKHGSSV